MNMDKKTILVIFFTIIGFSAYNYYLQSKYPDFYSGKLAESIQEDMTPEQLALLEKRKAELRDERAADASEGDVPVPEATTKSQKPL